MKLKFHFLVVVLFVFCVGCLNDASVENQLSTGPGISRSLSPDDPNMGPNWDWYTPPKSGKRDKVSFKRLSDGSIRSMDVNLPYFSHDEGTYEAKYCDDYHPKDGWVLLCRNFGDIDPPVTPFYMLYNKPKGIIRIFFYYTGDPATYAVVKLSSAKNVETSLFTFGKDEFSYINNYFNEKDGDGKKIWNGLQTVVSVMPFTWGIADFVLAYDPFISDLSDLYFDFWTVDQSKISIEGSSTINRLTHEEKVNFSLFDWAKSFGEIFRSVSDAYGKLKPKKNEFVQMDNEIERSSVSNSASDNKNIPPSTGFFTEAAAVIGAAVAIGGTIKGIIDGLNKKTTVVDKEWTDYSLKGEIVLVKQFSCFSIHIPGSKVDLEEKSSYYPLYNQPLGVFILNSKPTLSIRQSNLNQRSWKDIFGLRESFKVYSNNKIPGYKIKSIEASYIWKNENYNQMANSADGAKNYLNFDEWVKNTMIFSTSTLNANDYFLGGRQYVGTSRGVVANRMGGLTDDNMETDPIMKDCKIGIIATLVPDGTDPKIDPKSEVYILRTFTPTIQYEITKYYKGTIAVKGAPGPNPQLQLRTEDKKIYEIVGNNKNYIRDNYKNCLVWVKAYMAEEDGNFIFPPKIVVEEIR